MIEITEIANDLNIPESTVVNAAASVARMMKSWGVADAKDFDLELMKAAMQKHTRQHSDMCVRSHMNPDAISELVLHTLKGNIA